MMKLLGQYLDGTTDVTRTLVRFEFASNLHPITQGCEIALRSAF